MMLSVDAAGDADLLMMLLLMVGVPKDRAHADALVLRWFFSAKESSPC